MNAFIGGLFRHALMALFEALFEAWRTATAQSLSEVVQSVRSNLVNRR